MEKQWRKHGCKTHATLITKRNKNSTRYAPHVVVILAIVQCKVSAK